MHRRDTDVLSQVLVLLPRGTDKGNEDLAREIAAVPYVQLCTIRVLYFTMPEG